MVLDTVKTLQIQCYNTTIAEREVQEVLQCYTKKKVKGNCF